MAVDDRGGARRSAGIFDCERHGERLAIRCEDGRRLTYRELAIAADAAAIAFGPERTLVMIEAANALDPLLAYIGAMRARHAVLLVSAETAPDRLADIVARYRPAAGLRCRGEEWESWRAEPPHPALHPDLSLLLSTSGSTGSAKLVRLSRAALEANAGSIAEYLGVGAEDRAATTLPFHYSYGLSVVHSHLLCGATLLLSDRSVIDPAFGSFVREAGVTSMAGVPYTYELLDRAGFRGDPPPTLRTLTQAGGRLPQETAASYARWSEAHGVRFFVMYGQTEATARMAYMPPNRLAAHPGCIGVAIPGGQFRLVGEDGAEIAGDGVPGELVYRGANVMMGYALDAGDLAKPGEGDELRTGDLAEREASGLYRIVGRKSRFIKPFGVRVGLDDIERLFGERGIAAAATGDDALLAVRLVGNGTLDAAAEADRLASAINLPLAAVHVSVAEELPRLPSGKPDYPSILAAARREAARDADDGDIARLFAATFPRATVTPDATFASLGGDSLNYVALSTGLERALGHLPRRWEELSVADLQRLAPAAPPRARRWWQPREIESEVLIRALAILAVVVNHASSTLVVGGGANVLLMLFGYNLSRYQFARLTDGRGGTVVRDFGLRIMAPYYLFLVAWSLAKRQTDWPSLLLVSNYTGRFGSLMEPYWFLEALFQTMVAVVLAFALPSVRRGVAAHPWRAGLIMLGGGLTVALALNAWWPRPGLAYRTPELLFWLVGLGWAMHRALASSSRRGLLVGIIMLILATGYFHPFGWELGYPDGEAQRLWFAASCLLILFVPRLPVPAALAGGIAALAGASFYVYLTHVIPIHVLVHVMKLHVDAIVVPLAVAPGVAIWWLLRRRRGAAA